MFVDFKVRKRAGVYVFEIQEVCPNFGSFLICHSRCLETHKKGSSVAKGEEMMEWTNLRGADWQYFSVKLKSGREKNQTIFENMPHLKRLHTRTLFSKWLLLPFLKCDYVSKST